MRDMQIDAMMGRDRSEIAPVALGVFGCLLALTLGVVAATSVGLLVAGIIIALTVCVAAIVAYKRDPVLTLIWLWLFVVFDSPLSAIVGYSSSLGGAIRQADEILVLLFVCLTVWQSVRTNRRGLGLKFVLPGVGVAIFGLLGAVFHGVPFTVAAIGAWLGVKFWVIIGVTLLLPWKGSDIRRIYVTFIRVGVLVAGLGIADYVTHSAISRALHIGGSESEGFRSEAVHSIFPQPGQYSLFMSLLFALTFARFAEKRNRSDLILALLFAGSVMMSLRLKGVLALGAVAIIVALFQGIANQRNAVAVLLIGSLLFIGVYSVEGNVVAHQVSTFTSSESSARSRLYATGARIAKENFPLGVGFGRFASYPSRIYYSPVYNQYELSSVYGLSQAVPNFIDDTSWPSVIGETGYGGFFIYVAGVLAIIFAIIGQLRRAPDAVRWVPLAALCAVAALLVDSLGDPTLFDWVAVVSFAMILGPALMAVRDVGQPNGRSTWQRE